LVGKPNIHFHEEAQIAAGLHLPHTTEVFALKTFQNGAAWL